MCFSVNKCCFCVSLDAGTKVISVLSMVCTIATVVVYSGAAASLPETAQTKHGFYMLMTAIALCQLILCGMLVYGAFWTKPSYLWPWLVTSWIACGCLVLLSLLGAVLLTLQHHDDEETLADISTMSTFYFVYAAIVYYCTTVVQSRRMQMIRAEETESANTLVRRKHDHRSIVV